MQSSQSAGQGDEGVDNSFARPWRPCAYSNHIILTFESLPETMGAEGSKTTQDFSEVDPVYFCIECFIICIVLFGRWHEALHANAHFGSMSLGRTTLPDWCLQLPLSTKRNCSPSGGPYRQTEGFVESMSRKREPFEQRSTLPK